MYQVQILPLTQAQTLLLTQAQPLHQPQVLILQRLRVQYWLHSLAASHLAAL